MLPDVNQREKLLVRVSTQHTKVCVFVVWDTMDIHRAAAARTAHPIYLAPSRYLRESAAGLMMEAALA